MPATSQHTEVKPGQGCPACRELIKGNELDADFYWCDPKAGGCAHFHAERDCPEVVRQKQESVA